VHKSHDAYLGASINVVFQWESTSPSKKVHQEIKPNFFKPGPLQLAFGANIIS